MDTPFQPSVSKDNARTSKFVERNLFTSENVVRRAKQQPAGQGSSTRLTRQNEIRLAGAPGFEPGTLGFGDRCSTS